MKFRETKGMQNQRTSMKNKINKKNKQFNKSNVNKAKENNHNVRKNTTTKNGTAKNNTVKNNSVKKSAVEKGAVKNSTVSTYMQYSKAKKMLIANSPISPQTSHGTVRESLPSYGSYHLTIRIHFAPMSK